jgi:putative transposase
LGDSRDFTLSRTCLQSDIIAFVVFCRLRYRLTLRDLSEILLLRGIEVSHKTVRAWEAKLLPIMGDVLRKRRHGSRRQSGKSWYVDETCLRVRGRWTYLYRAIDRDGNLVDTILSATRDMESANAFFRPAKAIMGFTPERVTTDGHGSYPRAVRTILGTRVLHWTNVYLNNRLGQAHRGIKGRTRCMRGFRDHDAAGRFYREYDELRDLPPPALANTSQLHAGVAAFSSTWHCARHLPNRMSGTAGFCDRRGHWHRRFRHHHAAANADRAENHDPIRVATRRMGRRSLRQGQAWTEATRPTRPKLDEDMTSCRHPHTDRRCPF